MKLLNVGDFFFSYADQDDDFDTTTFRPTASPTLSPTHPPTKYNATLAKQRKKRVAMNESAWIAAMGASETDPADQGGSDVIQETPVGSVEPIGSSGGTP